MSRFSLLPYGIRGQVSNLPDKEFRYLRTVIVTAAVYRGFGSMLLRHSTLPAEFHSLSPSLTQPIFETA